jgi:hypothetical protein
MLVTCTITPSVFKQKHIVEEPYLLRSSCDQMGRPVQSSVRQKDLLSITGSLDTLSPEDGNRTSFRNIVLFFWTPHDVQIPQSTWSKIYINPLNAELNPICHLLVLLGAHPILHISRIRVNAVKTNPINAVYPIVKTRPIRPIPPILSNSFSKLAWRSSKRVFITTYLFAPDLFTTWSYCITFTLLCSKLQFEILLLLVG